MSLARGPPDWRTACGHAGNGISLGLASCKNGPTIGPERWETAFELLQLGPLA